MNDLYSRQLIANTATTVSASNASDVILTSGPAPTTFTQFRDPFYSSTIPQIYALAATTCLSYTLFILLIITPRSFLINDAVFLGRRGFTNGPSGISIGGRPWLQKVAAMTVAISLKIAMADTFKVAEKQYENGFMDAKKVQDQVEDGMELKIIRVISGLFLWLAQAQTLNRLFPRQREVIIQWTAFALITLDALFSVLNNFVYNGSLRPRTFVDAVPAPSYLFELALSLLYSAWVIYYAITKKKNAFYHPEMVNISLVAGLSLVSVLVPVVFFVLDVSKPALAGWGDYVRWVGAAAASLVVWEWVERIEALERNEKKDGILGREVFYGDEMLEVTPSLDFGRTKSNQHHRGGSHENRAGTSGRSWPIVSGIANRYRPRAAHDVEANQGSGQHSHGEPSRLPHWPRRPAPVATPISRIDTASAESTICAIRYHPISEATPPPQMDAFSAPAISRSNSSASSSRESIERNHQFTAVENATGRNQELHSAEKSLQSNWQALMKMNPFRRNVEGLPAEISAHSVQPESVAQTHTVSYGWDIRARLEDFAAAQADKIREKNRPRVSAEPLPRTVIPAPIRRRNLATNFEELEESEESERHQEGNHQSGTSETSPSGSVPSLQDRSQTRSSDHDPAEMVGGQTSVRRGSLTFVTVNRDQRGSGTYGDKDISSARGNPTRPLSISSSTSQAAMSRSASLWRSRSDAS